MMLPANDIAAGLGVVLAERLSAIHVAADFRWSGALLSSTNPKPTIIFVSQSEICSRLVLGLWAKLGVV